MANPARYTQSVTLASGASATTDLVNIDGAHSVYITISCDVTHQLSTANVSLVMQDGKSIAVTPAAFPNGVTATGTQILVANPLITLDLSSALHRGILVRAGDSAHAGAHSAEPIHGATGIRLALTKAATVGNAVYTIVTSVYRIPHR